MKKSLFFLLILFIVSSFLNLDSKAVASEWSEPVSGLRCKVETDKDVYNINDEIVFTLSWENLSKEDVLITYRQDHIPYSMLFFRRADDTLPSKRMLLVESAPVHKHRIAAGEVFSLDVKARLVREYLKEDWLRKEQEAFGNLILKFEGRILSEFPILLNSPGTLFVSLNYYLPADSFIAQQEPQMWTGEINSAETKFRIEE